MTRRALRIIVLRRRVQQRYPRRKDVQGAKQLVFETVRPLITSRLAHSQKPLGSQTSTSALVRSLPTSTKTSPWNSCRLTDPPTASYIASVTPPLLLRRRGRMKDEG